MEDDLDYDTMPSPERMAELALINRAWDEFAEWCRHRPEQVTREPLEAAFVAIAKGHGLTEAVALTCFGQRWGVDTEE